LASQEVMGKNLPMTELGFDRAVLICPSSGMPRKLATVSEAICAIRSLPTTVQGRIHWRLAAAILTLAADSKIDDIEMARHALVRVIETEGW
jgi:hypothetical protein